MNNFSVFEAFQNVISLCYSYVSMRRNTLGCWGNYPWPPPSNQAGGHQGRGWTQSGNISSPWNTLSQLKYISWYLLIEFILIVGLLLIFAYTPLSPKSNTNILFSLLSLSLSQGKVRAKVLTTLTSKLTQTERYLGEAYTNKSPVLTSALQEGLNQGKVLIAAVTASVPSKEKVP